jgi:short-subunit dehydrogenase
MKHVLVTGAYGGMGSKFIKLLNDNGYKVIALDYKQGDMDGVISIKTDITSEEDVNSAYNTIKTITDNLYAIVHFAGVYMLNSLVETPATDFEKIFKINLYGAFLINKTFMPMLKKGSKILITTSELAPLDPLPFTGIYGISKTALDKYAFSLRMELQLLGVSVSVLRAGAVDTGMIDVSMTALDDFINNTKLYNCNAKRFKSIVESVEAKKIKPITLAKKALKIIEKKKPKFAYKINRNPLLILLSLMPKRFQFFIIKQILK